MTAWIQLLRYSFFAPRHLSELTQGGFAYPTSYGLGRTLPTVRSTYPSVSPHRFDASRWYWNLNQLSITYAFRLGLGPDLPWADEPSPGILRFSAGGILTLLFAYSYRHSHFYLLHQALQLNFSANRTLPYPRDRFIQSSDLRLSYAYPLKNIWKFRFYLSFPLPQRKLNS